MPLSRDEILHGNEYFNQATNPDAIRTQSHRELHDDAIAFPGMNKSTWEGFMCLSQNSIIVGMVWCEIFARVW